MKEITSHELSDALASISNAFGTSCSEWLPYTMSCNDATIATTKAEIADLRAVEDKVCLNEIKMDEFEHKISSLEQKLDLIIIKLDELLDN